MENVNPQKDVLVRVMGMLFPNEAEKWGDKIKSMSDQSVSSLDFQLKMIAKSHALTIHVEDFINGTP